MSPTLQAGSDAQVLHGSLKRELAKDRNREFKYCRLTPAGKRRLIAEES